MLKSRENKQYTHNNTTHNLKQYHYKKATHKHLFIWPAWRWGQTQWVWRDRRYTCHQAIMGTLVRVDSILLRRFPATSSPCRAHYEHFPSAWCILNITLDSLFMYMSWNFFGILRYRKQQQRFTYQPIDMLLSLWY